MTYLLNDLKRAKELFEDNVGEFKEEKECILNTLRGLGKRQIDDQLTCSTLCDLVLHCETLLFCSVIQLLLELY